ncbi:MAG: SDR family NAD(P)-dependent oxidoreductase [Ilumatobacteraceae bacterium]
MSTQSSTRPVAVVTGASRGIGRAIAISLAASGHDLVLMGRTRAHDVARNPATGNVLPGDLDSTADSVRAHGARAHIVTADILELDDVVPSFSRCVAAVGRVDVLVNNAVYVGGGNDRRFAENSTDDIVRRVNGNLTAPLLLTHAFLRHVLEHNDGSTVTIIDITSDAGQRTPEHVAGRGGWSLSYAATKAGFHRIADMIALEYGAEGVRALNVNPGLVATERVLDSGSSLEWIARHGVRPDVIGTAVAMLLTDPEVPNGAYVHAQAYLRERLGDEKYGELTNRGTGS